MNALAWILIGWSTAALVWWTLAFWLVRHTERSPSPARPPAPGPAADPTADSLAGLSVFKPLPNPAHARERAALAEAIESFLVQLEPADELLLGGSPAELAAWAPVLDDWRRRFPHASLRVVPLTPPAVRGNPKIATLEALATQASRPWWLWSDADVVAPPGLLATLRHREESAADPTRTCAYAVRRAPSAWAVLDAAFVNAEFLPGALLLGRLGPLGFAFGAATCFRADTFRRRVSWEELRVSLADDYVLGRALQPVRLSPPLVETLALETTLPGAVRHYYRWQKTIRWCRPGSYAALLLILPLPAWALFAVLGPGSIGVLGFSLQWALETLAVALLCWTLRCQMTWGAWATLAAWPPLRALTWLAVWLPLPVTWRGPSPQWSHPRRNPDPSRPDSTPTKSANSRLPPGPGS